MRMTSRMMQALMAKMNDEQLDSDVTIEVPDELDGECYAAYLRICGEEHPSLDEGHPVIYCSDYEFAPDNTVESLAEVIGLEPWPGVKSK